MAGFQRPPINRVKPRLPVQSYISFEVRSPLGADFWRKATCEEVDCPRFLQGWVSRIDEGTTLGQAQAAYIRSDRSRKALEVRTPEGLTEFRYPPGQTCFRADEHRIRNDRPAIHLVRGGDWRGPTSPARVFERPDQWVETFAEHQDRLARAQN